MSEFLDIFTHGRKLQGAVKELSIEELEDCAEKLARIIDYRRKKLEEKQREEQQKHAKLEAIKQQIEEAGLDLDDLKALELPKKNKRIGQKRPVKYVLKDKDGNEHPWTGIGRMPRVYADALANGHSLDDYRI
ncbi:H-NS family nucleoid-associated regulatory protein [Aestuariibacter salexigens]|uniref:H-NS histone family protein n=1 Tax=Aestuariibacter salexigens TaxID=226010 RepID=UPI00041032A2|nr:H-NS family nucleoid-associated regulatory protein [Aestuariibacter salexigens]